MNDDWSLLGGGDVKIEPHKVKAKGKLGSMDNVGHEPGDNNAKVLKSIKRILHIGNAHSFIIDTTFFLEHVLYHL